MKVEKNPCTVQDTACEAGRGKQKPLTVPCFVCRAWTCLSCSVRMEVAGLGGRTYGTQIVCHDCATSLPGGADLVDRHLRFLTTREDPPASAPKRVRLQSGRRVPHIEVASAAAPSPAPAKARRGYPRERMEKLGYAR